MKSLALQNINIVSVLDWACYKLSVLRLQCVVAIHQLGLCLHNSFKDPKNTCKAFKQFLQFTSLWWICLWISHENCAILWLSNDFIEESPLRAKNGRRRPWFRQPLTSHPSRYKIFERTLLSREFLAEIIHFDRQLHADMSSVNSCIESFLRLKSPFGVIHQPLLLAQASPSHHSVAVDIMALAPDGKWPWS